MATPSKILATVRAVLATRTIIAGRFISGRVSLAEVVDASGCPRRPVLRVLDRLIRDGWLAQMEDVRTRPAPGEHGPWRRNPRYEVIRDIRLHRAAVVRSRVTCRDKIWTTLRTVRRATLSDLQRLTGCDENTCREYVHRLEQHGYVREVGKTGHEKIWALVKDAGPRRPETPETGRNA